MEGNDKKGISYGELIVPAIMITTIIVFLYQSVGIAHPRENLRLVWVVVCVLSISIVKILISIFKEKETEEERGKKSLLSDMSLLKRQAMLYVLVVIYVFLINQWGFIISSTILLPLMFLASGVRKYGTIFMISLFLPIITYIIFRKFFNILLPESFIEDFLVNNLLYRKWF